MIYTAYQRFFFLPPFEDLPPLYLSKAPSLLLLLAIATTHSISIVDGDTATIDLVAAH